MNKPPNQSSEVPGTGSRAKQSKQERAEQRRRLFGEFLASQGYELVQHRGEGSYGLVFAVRDPRDKHRPRALKICRVHVTPPTDPRKQEKERNDKLRFEQEFAIQKRFSFHPFLLGVHQFSSHETDGYLYLWYTMDLCEQTVREQIRSADLHPRIATALQFMNGLVFLHHEHVFHRDIKPNNLLVDAKGDVKIADFGSAKDLDTQDMQQTALLAYQIGGIPYMAPELFRAQQMEPDEWARCDQFSAGVTLYEILTKGSLPYPEVRELVSMPDARARSERAPHVYTEAKKPHPIRIPELSDKPLPKLDTVFAKMLATNPSKRYPSIRDAMTELNIALHAYRLHPQSGTRVSVAATAVQAGSPSSGEPASGSSGGELLAAQPQPRPIPGLAAVYALYGAEPARPTMLQAAEQPPGGWTISASATAALPLPQALVAATTQGAIVFDEPRGCFVLQDCSPRGDSNLGVSLRDGAFFAVASGEPVALPDYATLTVGGQALLRLRTWRSSHD